MWNTFFHQQASPAGEKPEQNQAQAISISSAGTTTWLNLKLVADMPCGWTQVGRGGMISPCNKASLALNPVSPPARMNTLWQPDAAPPVDTETHKT